MLVCRERNEDARELQSFGAQTCAHHHCPPEESFIAVRHAARWAMPPTRRGADISKVSVRQCGASLHGHRQRFAFLSHEFRSPFELHSEPGLSFVVLLRRDGSGSCLFYRLSNLAACQLAAQQFDRSSACLSTLGQGSHRWIILFSLSPASPPSFAGPSLGFASAFFLGLHVHRQLLVSLRRRSCLFFRYFARNGGGPATRPVAHSCFSRRAGRNDNAIPSVSLRRISVVLRPHKALRPMGMEAEDHPAQLS